MISSFFAWLLGLLFTAIGSALDVIFGLFEFSYLPNTANFSTYMVQFWDLVFQFVGYFRSALLLGSFEMGIIMDILVIKLTYKPMIAMFKMFVHWWDKLKI